MKWLWFALKNVRRNRRRSALTILIAAIGTAALLVGGGFAQFSFSGLREQAVRETGHLVLAHRGYFDGDEEAPMEHGLDDPQAVKARLEGDARVRAVLPRLQFSGLLSNGEKSAVFIGTGVEAAGELRVRGPFLSVTAGSTLAPSPAPADLPEIMLGKELARQLKAEPGSALTLLATTVDGTLNAQDVRVKGIYSLGVPELDKRAVLVHLATAQKLLLTRKVSTASIYLWETASTDTMRAEVARLFPGRALQTWRDQAFYYRAVRQMYERIFGLLGLVLVVIVLFTVSNTLGMTVVERTREIGTLRALGAVPLQIVRNFILEGLVVGGTGAAAGMAVATVTGLLFRAFGLRMPPPPGWSVGYPLRLEITLSLYAVAGLSVMAASALAAWSVSRKAAARSIVEALTHV